MDGRDLWYQIIGELVSLKTFEPVPCNIKLDRALILDWYKDDKYPDPIKVWFASVITDDGTNLKIPLCLKHGSKYSSVTKTISRFTNISMHKSSLNTAIFKFNDDLTVSSIITQSVV